jgi:hypothetical protein
MIMGAVVESGPLWCCVVAGRGGGRVDAPQHEIVYLEEKAKVVFRTKVGAWCCGALRRICGRV